ncbi:MAG: type II secretion system F family protein [Planctomycetes bacterium]|nr:type II secretion system F family protein [Planctomycetota bacterium]
MNSDPWSEAKIAWRRWLQGPGLNARMFLYEELASLTGAGIAMREAVRDLAARSSGRRRRALEGLDHDLARGLTPGAAFMSRPESFAPVEAHLIASGERTGRYDRAFRDAAAEVERARKTQSKVLRAVAYPLFLLHFALLVPAYAILRQKTGPLTAQVVVCLALLAFWGLVVGGITLHLARRGRPAWGRAVATFPLFGEPARHAALARASRVAAALQDAGADLADSFDGAADASGNGWVAEDLRAACEDVRRGRTATESLSRVKAYGTDARSLLETGEKSGAIAEAFARIATIEDERFDGALRRAAVALNAILFGAAVLIVVWMLFSTMTGAMGM